MVVTVGAEPLTCFGLSGDGVLILDKNKQESNTADVNILPFLLILFSFRGKVRPSSETGFRSLGH